MPDTRFMLALSCALSAAWLGACAAPPPEHACPSVSEARQPTSPPRAQPTPNGDALQVLGSGGPIPDDGRASSGYLIWHQGKARALIDAGGGVFVRFGEAGASIADLDVVAISHLHADHAGELASLLKGGYFSRRERPLPIIGPSRRGRFPAMDEHLRALLDADAGAFRYLAGYLSGDELFPLPVTVVDAESREPQRVWQGERVAIDAVGVHHGTIPALGFVVTVGERRVAFAGDQAADNEAFAAMAAGVDVLVAHHALPERGFEGVTHLHRIPSEIGALAAAVKPGRLVLSHHMQRALADREVGLAAIRAHYSGPIDLADDLAVYPLTP